MLAVRPAGPAAAASPGAAPAKAGPLFLLALVGTLSHPFLDWLNTYGVRLLMPFSARWFYGDALFIVDPFLWMVLGRRGHAGVDHAPARRPDVDRRSGTGHDAAAGRQPAGALLGPRMVWLAGVAAWVAARLLVPAALAAPPRRRRRSSWPASTSRAMIARLAAGGAPGAGAWPPRRAGR